jgi:hypothetical protein
MAGGFILPSVARVARLPGAGERLAKLLQSRTMMEFVWGVNDCCLFAADAVLEQLGVDPAEPLRGRYTTALQAERVLHLVGGLEGICRSTLGEPLRYPMLACVGDVGIVDERMSQRRMLAVCIGEWWTLPTAKGLGLMPLDDAATAWRVGCA